MSKSDKKIIEEDYSEEEIVKDCVEFYRGLRIKTWKKNYPLTKEFQEDLEKTIRKAINLTIKKKDKEFLKEANVKRLICGKCNTKQFMINVMEKNV